jgi:hypothetical protein
MSDRGPGRPLVSHGPGSRLRRVVPAIILMVLGLASGSVHAEFVLGFGQTNYQVGPGQGVDVPVYLTESGTDILATAGLNSAGLVVSFNLPPMVSDPAQVTTITPNPGVSDVNDFISTSITPATGSKIGTAELLFSILLSGVLKPPSGSSSVLLGTYHLVAGSVPDQVTQLSTGIVPGGPQFLSGTGQQLDSMITTSTATITTQTVPGPPGIVLLGTGILSVIGYACRLRRGVLRAL